MYPDLYWRHAEDRGGLFTHGGNRVSSSAGYRKEVMGNTYWIIDVGEVDNSKKRGDYNEMAV